MNSSWMQDQAVAFSKRVSQVRGSQRIRRAYQLALSREPTETETEAAIAFMTRIEEANMSTQDKLVAYCQALMCTADNCTMQVGSIQSRWRGMGICQL